jgi:hypothetical protein
MTPEDVALIGTIVNRQANQGDKANGEGIGYFRLSILDLRFEGRELKRVECWSDGVMAF